MTQSNLLAVDWSTIPSPTDDDGTSHLKGKNMPALELASTEGGLVDLAKLRGCSVLYFYPMTGKPNVPLPDGWDNIPGARGCTPQACVFRDLSQEFKAAGVTALFGVSTQTTNYQREAAERLHLPFPLLSDAKLELVTALSLPTMNVDEMVLTKRLTLILRDDQIRHVFYPVFPPDENAKDVLSYIKGSVTA